MKLSIENKNVELVFTTRKIVNLTKELKEKNLEDLYFRIMNENDIEALARIIYVFAEDKDTGISAFKDINEVYEFMDNYMLSENKTYNEVFNEIAEAINEEGFFKTKMSKAELQEKISNEVIKTSTEKAIAKIAEAEFKLGNKA